MPLAFILARVRHYWHHLTALTVVVALLTGFTAFYPLYSGVLSTAHVENRIENTRALDFELNVRNVVNPIVPQVETALQDELGDLYQTYVPVIRTSGVICGLSYPNPFNCFQFATYDDLDSLVTLREGKLPQIRDRQDNIPQIEAVVMPRPAHLTQTEIGRMIAFGASGTPSLHVDVVGIVEPISPDDVFWSTQPNVVQGIKTQVGSDYRDDMVLILTPEAFAEHIVPLYRDSLVYSWRVSVDPTVITADNLTDIEDRMLAFEQSYFQLHPDGTVDNSLLALVSDIRTEVDSALLPVFTFAFVIGAWMLCLVFYLSYLLFRAQKREWQVLVERGVDLRQIVFIQLGTVFGVALVAVILAPLIAYGLLVIVHSTGPVALALQSAGSASFSITVLLNAMTTGLLALLVMVGAVWLQFRLDAQDTGNPAEPLFLLRYFVDFGVFLLGGALILRVYFLNSDNLSDSIESLFRDPGSLINVIAMQSGTDDPLNLLGPVLMIFGVALFSLRFLPPILHLLAMLPLGMWSLTMRESRRPQHYGFPVLLLIVTALIGVTAFTLSNTYAESLWRKAYLDNGGNAQIVFDDTRMDVRTVLSDLPETVIPALNLTEINPTQITLLAVDPTLMAEHHPEWADALAMITTAEPTPLAGFVLPDDAAAFSLQVYANTSDEQPAMLNIFLTLEDALGISQRVTLQTDNPRNMGSFMEYRVDLPTPIKPPWRMTALSFTSERDTSYEMFNQIALIDTLKVIAQDGTEILIEDFERNRLAEWQIPELQSRGLVAVRTDSLQYSGDASLRVSYEADASDNNDPPLNTIPVNTVARVRAIPVLVSQSLAEAWGQTYNNRTPLPVGFEQQIILPPGLGGLPVDLAVREVIADFPTLMDGERFLVAPIEQIRMHLNTAMSPDEYYRWNTAYLISAGRTVSDDVQSINAGKITYTLNGYEAQRRSPLDNALFGLLYSGFLLAFGAYCIVLVLDVIARRDDSLCHTLHLVGMSPRGIRTWKALEYAVPLLSGITLALLFGSGLTVLLLPFLAVESVVIIPWMRYGLIMFVSSVILIGLIGVVLSRWRPSLKKYAEEM